MAAEINSDQLLDFRWFVEFCGIHTVTGRRLLASGQGPRHYKIGGSIRFRRNEVEDWLLSRLVDSQSETTGGQR